MSAQTPEQEPSIEEILASIRQIISDDDEGAPAAAAAEEEEEEIAPEPAKPAPEPVAPPKPVAPVAKSPVAPPAAVAAAPVPPRDDILELRDPLPPPSPRPVIDMEDSTDDEDEKEFVSESNVIEDPFDAFDSTVKEVVVAPVTRPEPSRPAPVASSAIDAESILGETARSAALSGFTKLASNMPLERTTTPHRSTDGTTIEDVLRDMLAPMLRDWLDENLPTIIEKLVQKELDKLARRASDD